MSTFAKKAARIRAIYAECTIPLSVAPVPAGVPNLIAAGIEQAAQRMDANGCAECGHLLVIHGPDGCRVPKCGCAEGGESEG